MWLQIGKDIRERDFCISMPISSIWASEDEIMIDMTFILKLEQFTYHSSTLKSHGLNLLKERLSLQLSELFNPVQYKINLLRLMALTFKLVIYFRTCAHITLQRLIQYQLRFPNLVDADFTIHK